MKNMKNDMNSIQGVMPSEKKLININLFGGP